MRFQNTTFELSTIQAIDVCRTSQGLYVVKQEDEDLLFLVCSPGWINVAHVCMSKWTQHYCQKTPRNSQLWCKPRGQCKYPLTCRLLLVELMLENKLYTKLHVQQPHSQAFPLFFMRSLKGRNKPGDEATTPYHTFLLRGST